MWYLYLDESGDLGFDFVNKKPSKYFTITVLAINGTDTNRNLIKAVRQVSRRKLPKGRELKGAFTDISVKEYFYKLVKPIKFGVYALTLNKKRVFEKLTEDKARVYNYIARLLLEKIPYEKATNRVELIIDRSKSKPEIRNFNEYIFNQLKSRLNPQVPLDIFHYISNDNYGLQAVDLFSWGIFRQYEKKDKKWSDIFRSKVVFDDVYLR